MFKSVHRFVLNVVVVLNYQRKLIVHMLCISVQVY